MLILGLIVNQAGLALANDVPKTVLPELTIYGGNRIPMNQELTNLRINTVKLKVEDNDWKTVLQEQVQINELGPGGPVSLFMRGSIVYDRWRQDVFSNQRSAKLCRHCARLIIIC